MKVSRRTKAAREAMADIDYMDKLSPAEAAWMETFMQATSNNDTDAMATLVNQDPIKLGRLQTQIFAEDHAKRRDMLYLGNRIEMDDGLDGEATAALVDDVNFSVANPCRRCLSRSCKCGPRFKLQHKRYDQADYLPHERTEDAVIGEIDLAQRMEAFDLLPYGDAPAGLEQGHAVKVCLPHHLLDKAVGYVLEFRPVAGDYLVRSMSKQGLRNEDGSRPRATLLYVKPEGLKRSRPEIVKAFTTSSDKKNGGTAA